jgi:predicted NBD/HSP70 family sugar kinase
VRSIHVAGEISRRELADITGLSFATVGTICTDLLTRGVLMEASRDAALVGRPTTNLALNPDHGLLLGVEIAEAFVHAETFDTALRSLTSSEAPIDSHASTPADVVAKAAEVIEAEVAKHNTKPLAIGVSAPGAVDPVGGTSVFSPYWAWHNVPLLDMLSDRLGAPLLLDNPLKALAIAEFWSRPELRDGDHVIAYLGTGVGAGVLIGGTLFRGRSNTAGEWGHTVLIAGGRQCRCGAKGCVEAYIGSPGILETLRGIDPTSPLLDDEDQVEALTGLARACDEGDPTALTVVRTTAHYLGVALASLINLLNPQTVLIGGWIGALLGPRLLDAARPYVEASAFPTSYQATTLEISALYGYTVALGMAASAFEDYLDHPATKTTSLLKTTSNNNDSRVPGGRARPKGKQ